MRTSLHQLLIIVFFALLNLVTNTSAAQFIDTLSTNAPHYRCNGTISYMIENLGGDVYKWNSGGGFWEHAHYVQQIELPWVSEVPAGTHDFKHVAANGEEYFASFTITQPDPEGTLTPIFITHPDIGCSNGELQFEFALNDMCNIGWVRIIVNDNLDNPAYYNTNGYSMSTFSIGNELAAGTYNIKLTEVYNTDEIFAETTYELTSPGCPSLTHLVTNTCPGTSNGSIIGSVNLPDNCIGAVPEMEAYRYTENGTEPVEFTLTGDEFIIPNLTIDEYLIILPPLQTGDDCPGFNIDVVNAEDCGATTWYHDEDGDGYYGEMAEQETTPGDGWFSEEPINGGGDCNDTDEDVHPNATEICNGFDDNCVNGADENLDQANNATVSISGTNPINKGCATGTISFTYETYNCWTSITAKLWEGSQSASVLAGEIVLSNPSSSHTFTGLLPGNYFVKIKDNSDNEAISGYKELVEPTLNCDNISFDVEVNHSNYPSTCLSTIKARVITTDCVQYVWTGKFSLCESEGINCISYDNAFASNAEYFTKDIVTKPADKEIYFTNLIFTSGGETCSLGNKLVTPIMPPPVCQSTLASQILQLPSFPCSNDGSIKFTLETERCGTQWGIRLIKENSNEFFGKTAAWPSQSEIIVDHLPPGMYEVNLVYGGMGGTECQEVKGNISLFSISSSDPTVLINPQGTINWCLPTLTLTPVPSSGFAFDWYKDGVYQASGESYTVYYSGSYTVRAFGDNCDVTSAPTIVKFPVKPEIKVNGNSTDLCNKDHIKLSTDNEGVSYQWMRDYGTTIPNATDKKYKVTEPDEYAVIVTDANGCTEQSAYTAITSSCRMDKDNEMRNFVFAYPNPVSESVTIQFARTVETRYILQLQDLTGKIIIERKGVANVGGNSIDVDLTDYAKGVYFIYLKTADQIQQLKLVKQ